MWTHFDLAKAALENGKHVFVEKPFTSTPHQAEELIELAERKNLKIMVDHTFLFSGAVRKIREIVDAGTLGPLYYFDSTRVNLGLFQHDVSVVWDLAPHDLSIMDHIIAERPEAVVATGGNHLNGHADMAFITIYFPRNIIAHINVNWLSPVKVRTTLIGGTRQDAGLERPRGRREDQGLRQGRQDHQPRRASTSSSSATARATSGRPKCEQTEGPDGRTRILRRLHSERCDADERWRGGPARGPAARRRAAVVERPRPPRRAIVPAHFRDSSYTTASTGSFLVWSRFIANIDFLAHRARFHRLTPTTVTGAVVRRRSDSVRNVGIAGVRRLAG